MNITLKPQEGGTLAGIVEDEKGRAIPNARISANGLKFQTVITDEDGRFNVNPHLADGQMVQVHVEAFGFQPADISQPAGKYGFVVMLQSTK